MFFVISKILAHLVYPLAQILLLSILALCFYRKPRIAKTCIALAVLLILILGTYPVPQMMMRFLETRYKTVSPPPHVDAVVVLAGMVILPLSNSDNIEFNDSAERIHAGIRLMKRGYAEKLIISGGSGDLFDQEKSEARLLKQFAIDFGIPEENILIEPNSRNTYENAFNTRALLEKHGISRIILVTTASHLPRAVRCFKKLGMQPIPYGVDYHSRANPSYDMFTIIPKVGALEYASAAIHEYVGLLIYTLLGYI
jgi:uncharacterized SAM-binding protein YcdF (DUF218 family)